VSSLQYVLAVRALILIYMSIANGTAIGHGHRLARLRERLSRARMTPSEIRRGVENQLQAANHNYHISNFGNACTPRHKAQIWPPAAPFPESGASLGVLHKFDAWC
jgi:hypothetical protein